MENNRSIFYVAQEIRLFMLLALLLLVNISQLLKAQNINSTSPVEVNFVVSDFNQETKIFEVTLSVTSKIENADLRFEVMVPSFVSLIGGNNIQTGSLNRNQSKLIKLRYQVTENQNFKIKCVVDGIDRLNKSKISEAEYLFFSFVASSYSILTSNQTSEKNSGISYKTQAMEKSNEFNKVESIMTSAEYKPSINLQKSNSPLANYRIYGNLKYTGRNNVRYPIRYAKVRIMDKDITWDSELGVTSTDANGNYSLTVSSSELNGPDIYIEVITEGISNTPVGSNGITVIRDDIFSNYYYMSSIDYVINNMSTTEANISFQEGTTGVNLGAFAVYDSFVEGWIRSKELLNINIDKVTTYWPASTTAKINILWIDFIKILQGDRFDRDVIVHEYGHFVDQKYSLVDGVGGTHSWGVRNTGSSGARLAMSEAWATFYSIAIQYAQTNDWYYDDTEDQNLHDDLENNFYQGDNDEAAACGILWDIFDSRVESHDNLSTSLAEIWRILRSGSRLENIQGFATKWKDLGKGNLTELTNIYSHFGVTVNLGGGSTTPRALTVNGSALSGNLSVANQEDWYSFVTSSGGNYIIETHGGNDTYLDLYQSNKTTLITSDDDSGEGASSLIVTSLSASTTYYVKVTGYGGGAVGVYTIDVKREAAVFNPPRNLASTSGNGQVVLSWQAPSSKPMLGDEPSSKRELIERLGLSESPLYKVESRKAEGEESTLGLSNYKVFRSSSENGSYTLISSPTSTSYTNSGLSNGSTYWYYVTAVYTNPNGESGASNKVSGTPSGGGSTTPRALTVNGSALSGNLSVANQEDWYSFTYTASGTYKIETYGGHDTYIWLYRDDKTTLIAEDDDSGTNSGCSKILVNKLDAVPLTRYIKVKGYDGGAVGTYSIDIQGPGSFKPQGLIANSIENGINLRWTNTISTISSNETNKNLVKGKVVPNSNLNISYIDWNSKSSTVNPSIAYFSIYRKSSNENLFSLLSNVKNTEYMDNSLTNGVGYSYYIKTVYNNIEINATFTDTVSVFASVQVESKKHNQFQLDQNYPNPFNPSTNIKFSVPQNSFVSLIVFDVLGNQVASLVNENKNEGVYSVDFDGSRLSSGVYYYRLTAGTFTLTKKLLLIK